MINPEQFFEIMKLLILEHYRDKIKHFESSYFNEETELQISFGNIKILMYYNTTVFIKLYCPLQPDIKLTISSDKFDNIDEFFYKIKSTIDKWIEREENVTEK